MNHIVTTLAPSFLVGSSLLLQATSKTIISRMGSKCSRSDQALINNLPLSVRKKSHRLIMGEIL